MSDFTITRNEKKKGSTAIIEGDIKTEAINKKRNKALNSFQTKITIDGFRSGHIPETILVSKVGELAIYEECASLALEEHYSSIIKASDIHPIGNPKVSITKITVGEPVSFKIESTVIPEIKLPDYKKIAEEKNKEETQEIKVEEKDVDDALEEMRRSIAHYEKSHSAEATLDTHHGDHTGKDIPEEELPVLDDEFAKKVGNFPSLVALKTKIQENILNEEKVKEREKRRLKIIDEIINKSEFEIPDVLVESELNKMVLEFKDNLERMKIGYEEYLKHINKSEDELKKEWHGEALKRANIQLVLKEIGVKEKIELPADTIKKEVDTILKQYKDADRTNVEIYVTNILLNEEVWKFLEQQK